MDAKAVQLKTSAIMTLHPPELPGKNTERIMKMYRMLDPQGQALLDPEYQITTPPTSSIKEADHPSGTAAPKYNSINPADFPEVPLGPMTHDLKGQTFGRLTVVHHVGKTQDRQQNARWLCLCSCGHHVVTLAGNLKNGSTSSCGCQVADSPEYKVKRGQAGKHPHYRTWYKLRKRIGTPAPFGRTNNVCSRWMNSFEAGGSGSTTAGSSFKVNG